MNPSDFRICHLQFRYSLYACVALKHKYGSPVLHDSSSTAYHPCYPERYDDPLSFSQIIIYGFPLCPQGQHLHFKLTRLHLGSLALRSAVLPIGNLQPLITQTLLPGAKEAYEQLLLRDFNPIRFIADNGIRTQYLIIIASSLLCGAELFQGARSFS